MPAVVPSARGTRSRLQPEVGGRTHAIRVLREELHEAHDRAEQLGAELGVKRALASQTELVSGAMHNVGNLLTGVGVGLDLMEERLSRSRVAALGRLAQLLTANAADLGAFVTHDPRGKAMPAFVEALASELAGEVAQLVREVRAARTQLAHTTEVVRRQQRMAVRAVAADVGLEELVADVLTLCASSRGTTAVEVTCGPGPARVRLDRGVLVEVLVNLVNNALDAVVGGTAPRVAIEISYPDVDTMSIAVADNGIGIPSDVLERLFQFGFTTKATGHGFGLHACRRMVAEAGGALTVWSEGTGLGATFVVRLPITQGDHV